MGLTFRGFGVDGVPQAVADQVDADGGKAQRDGRKYPSPPVVRYDGGGLGTGEHITPGGVRFHHTEAQEG